jgi:hypothetical protein
MRVRSSAGRRAKRGDWSWGEQVNGWMVARVRRIVRLWKRIVRSRVRLWGGTDGIDGAALVMALVLMFVLVLGGGFDYLGSEGIRGVWCLMVGSEFILCG